MFTVVAGTRDELAGMETELASYRYSVFIEHLHWQLPVHDGLERDQFDRPDTLYIMVRDEAEMVCGCARLLPTTSPYLLDEVFPHLMNGAPSPHDADTWELSRFSNRPWHDADSLSREESRRRFRTLFASVVEAALKKGATRLITFTAMGVERILRSIGMHAHRVGPPQLIDGEPVLALWIELDAITCAALDVSSKEAVRLSH